VPRSRTEEPAHAADIISARPALSNESHSPPLVNAKALAWAVLDTATRCNGKGKASKVQASIGQYVVRQHAGTLGGIHPSEKVSVTGKSSSEYAPHSSTANYIQSSTTRTANMTEKALSEDNWSKDREEKHPASEKDGAARPTASLRKLRSQDRVKSPVATRYVLDSDSE